MKTAIATATGRTSATARPIALRPPGPPPRASLTDSSRDVSIRSRIEALPALAEEARRQTERVPGSKLVYEVLANERRVGGARIEAGGAFRLFLWPCRLGLVAVAAPSRSGSTRASRGWRTSAQVRDGAPRRSGGAKALTEGAATSTSPSFGIVALAWFTLTPLRPRSRLPSGLLGSRAGEEIRRPLLAILFFNVVSCGRRGLGRASPWLRAPQVGAGSGHRHRPSASSLVMGLALVAMWFPPHPPVRFRDLLPGANPDRDRQSGGPRWSSSITSRHGSARPKRPTGYSARRPFCSALVWLYVEARLAVGAASSTPIVHRRHGRGPSGVAAPMLARCSSSSRSCPAPAPVAGASSASRRASGASRWRSSSGSGASVRTGPPRVPRRSWEREGNGRLRMRRPAGRVRVNGEIWAHSQTRPARCGREGRGRRAQSALTS